MQKLISPKCLLDSRAGLRDCLMYLKSTRGYKWDQIEPINEGRYYIIKGNPNISVVFKTAWFLKFREQGFLDEKGNVEKGIGDTVNVSDLKLMVSHCVKEHYVVYQDGKIYTIPLFELISKSHKWTNKEGKEVRSYSIHHLKRLN